MKTKFIQTRITEDLFKKLKARADEEERSTSGLMRVIIKEYLKNNENNGENLPMTTKKALSHLKNIEDHCLKHY